MPRSEHSTTETLVNRLYNTRLRRTVKMFSIKIKYNKNIYYKQLFHVTPKSLKCAQKLKVCFVKNFLNQIELWAQFWINIRITLVACRLN